MKYTMLMLRVGLPGGEGLAVEVMGFLREEHVGGSRELGRLEATK